MMKKKNQCSLAILSLAAFAALSFTACSQAPVTSAESSREAVQSEAGNTIQVQSSATVQVVPDVAELQFGVLSQGEDAETCREENAKDVNAVLDYLKGQNIAETSIQTSDTGMYPRYDYRNGGNEITGYEMTTQIVVSDLPIDQLSGILTAAVSAGINNIDSVRYMASDYDASYQEALKQAIAAAKTKAQVMADAAGVTLGGVVKMDEMSSYTDRNRYQNAMRASSAADMESASAIDMNIMAGTLDVSAEIQVTFAIQ